MLEITGARRTLCTLFDIRTQRDFYNSEKEKGGSDDVGRSRLRPPLLSFCQQQLIEVTALTCYFFTDNNNSNNSDINE